MENKINIAELLKDCPRGMELDCTMYENVYFDKTYNEEDCLYPIGCYIIGDNNRNSVNFTKYGEFNYHSNAKCIIFPKGKTTWEGFTPPCRFKDGDVIYNQGIKATAIFYKQISSNTISHCFLNVNKELRILHYHCTLLYDWRLATEEEKQKLFQAIKDKGYYWNAETKTLEELIEPIFNIGDKIKKKDGSDNRLIIIESINNNYYVIKTPDWFDNCYITDKLPFDYQNKYELAHSNKGVYERLHE